MSILSAVSTKAAPAAVGPYSQAIVAGDVLYVSGQIGLNPETGKLEGDTVQDQTHQVFKNIAAILKAKNLDFSHVIKMEIFILDMGEFSGVNAIYGSYLPHEPKPARQTVAVSALPLGALIEISCVAYCG